MHCFARSGQLFIDLQQQLAVIRVAANVAANGMSIITTSSDAAARRTRAFYDAAAARESACAASHSSASGEKRLMRDFLYSFVGYSARFSSMPLSMARSLMIDSHSSTERPCTIV